MKRLGVLGWPVSHSRSPRMHNAALARLGLKEWHYQRLPVPPEVFEETVRGLPAAGFVGANVTIPHKEAALALAGEATDAARAIGAANTLSFAADGTIAAANTDAPGFLAALAGIDQSPAGQTALVLGAGGSARAVAYGLREAGAARSGTAPPSGPRRWPLTWVSTPLLGRSRPTCWSTARVSGWRTGTSRICRSTPMRWAHTQPWRTWSTGPAAPS
jgi:shikimate dehydrogenase